MKTILTIKSTVGVHKDMILHAFNMSSMYAHAPMNGYMIQSFDITIIIINIDWYITNLYNTILYNRIVPRKNRNNKFAMMQLKLKKLWQNINKI